MRPLIDHPEVVGAVVAQTVTAAKPCTPLPTARMNFPDVSPASNGRPAEAITSMKLLKHVDDDFSRTSLAAETFCDHMRACARRGKVSPPKTILTRSRLIGGGVALFHRRGRWISAHGSCILEYGPKAIFDRIVDRHQVSPSHRRGTFANARSL